MNRPPPPPKFIGFFDLVEATRRPGCPVCLRVAEETRRSIESFLYESVNDPGLRDQIRRDGGLCHRHTWQLVGFADALGCAILFRDVLAASTERLDCARPGWFSKRPAVSPRPCLFCRLADRSLAGVIYTLAAHVEDPELAPGWAGPAVLCVPHLRQVCGHIEHAGVRQRLLVLHRRKYAGLCDEIGQLIAKQSYDHRPGEIGAEKDSWVRAAAALVGHAR